jgi:hypothetical protein
MHSSTLLTAAMVLALLAACSERSAPQVAHEASSPQATLPPLDAEPGAVRAKLNAGGIPAVYVAHFEMDQLARIDEQRQIPDVAPLRSEYTFKGARLLSYRGAKLSDAAQLDLQFDMQGVLQSGQGPNVNDEEIAAIRNRAQLLRSHALAQRATKMH